MNEKNYEDLIYLDLTFDYWYTRIYYRNIEMINKSDLVLFFVEKTENSGAYKALKFAIKNKKDYINFGKLNSKT